MDDVQRGGLEHGFSYRDSGERCVLATEKHGRTRKTIERFRALSAKEIWSMLNMLTPLEETKAYQSIFAEGEAKGEAEGEAKGEAKGKAMTLKRLLKRRFARVPTWAEQRIDAAPEAQVDAWLNAIFDATSVEDLLRPAPGTDAV